MPIKIVLVEDSETVQIAAKMIMKSEREYEILCAKSLLELAPQMASLKPDLLVIDQSLSNDSALMDMQPVLYLIPHNTATPSSNAKISYLKKPFDSQSFLKAVQNSLAGDQKVPARAPVTLPPMETPRTTPVPRPSSEMAALSKEELREMARNIIEEIAWEVVPELAESIIRDEIRRLTKE